MERSPRPADPGDDPALSPVRVLLEEQLSLASTSWSAGAPGVLARFARDDDERAQRGPNSVVTAHGGLRVVLPDEAVAVAYETPGTRDPLRWHHAVAFCVPDEVARCAGRTAVTELGPDDQALRPADLSGVLFDLGLGTPAADVCVRTADPEALAALRAALGHHALDGDLLERLTAGGPHVVVRTAAGRLEITASGAGTGLRLRPARIGTASGLPAHVAHPAGWTPVLRCHPAHPVLEPDGRPRPYDAERAAAFEALLAEHGDPVLGVHCADVVDAVRGFRGPDSLTLPDDAATRAAVGVTLRRLAFTDGTSGTLASWRSRYGPDAGLGEPDED